MVAVAAAALRGLLAPRDWTRAVIGLVAAWGASSLSVAGLILSRGGPPRAFLRAFGAGVVLRGLVLVVLMAVVMGGRLDRQSPLLAAYALGVLGLLLVEYRHLAVKTK